jgi:integrase
LDIETFLSSRPYAENTKDRYRRVLRELVLEPDIQHWTPPRLLQFIQRPNWGNSQQCLALEICKVYLRAAFGDDHPALITKLKRVRPKPQRTLTLEIAVILLASFNPHTAKGARDLAIACVALDTGLRVSELARILLAHTDLIARTIQVIVKGGQWQVAIFSPATANVIEKWLSFRKAYPGVNTLFVSTKTGTPLSTEGLKAIVKKWGRDIGIKLSAHDLRRSFATLSTVLGAPSRVVQVAGRWSSIDMVERYTQGLDAHAITPYLPVTRLLRDEPPQPPHP